MNKQNPIKLHGNWIEGFAFDYHIIYSEYLGVDEWGRELFDTKRTEIGQLLYELKYKKDKLKAESIVQLIGPFLNLWGISNKIDYIIPVPPSIERRFQPVFELSQKIGEHLKKQVLFDVVKKNNPTQSKNLVTDNKNEITGSIVRTKRFPRKVNLLIIDDLYQSGKTLNETAKELKNDQNVNNIYVLTMTKTRR
ncbi:ComF family protein [Heyndrickxia sporothermodurans]|uniref:ComF family protein n=1 Tax=Heyndrickxia sporothermodurans TaxID=46224 RepID=UPI00192CCA42|nr:ComF family protein [Heyndrickxia sporothermodurans]MBL5889726.1 ComF family protein [Heyndrickxia sporothermodurans]MBL5896989.1 ComF family protein [Heyndrickxia sporothermodurans]